MKHFIIAIISSFLLQSSVLHAQNSISSKEVAISKDSLYPILKFDTTVLNCDTIEEGMLYNFVYHFTNVGTDTLRILQVRSSCGCYVPSWSRRPIAPGERGKITGRYSSKGRPGPFTKTMTVVSNDLIKPRHILMCKGYTKRKIPLEFPRIKIDTSTISIDTIPEGDRFPFQFKISNTGIDTLRISNVYTSCKCILPSWTTRKIAPGESAKLLAFYNTKGRPGSFTKTVRIISNDPKQSVYFLKAKGFVYRKP